MEKDPSVKPSKPLLKEPPEGFFELGHKRHKNRLYQYFIPIEKKGGENNGNNNENMEPSSR